MKPVTNSTTQAELALYKVCLGITQLTVMVENGQRCAIASTLDEDVFGVGWADNEADAIEAAFVKVRERLAAQGATLFRGVTEEAPMKR